MSKKKKAKSKAKAKPRRKVAVVESAPVEEGRKAQRLNMRLSWKDYQRLIELRSLLRAESDSSTVRTLIRLHYAAEQSALAKLRRTDPTAVAQIERLTERARQMGLFPEDVS